MTDEYWDGTEPCPNCGSTDIRFQDYVWITEPDGFEWDMPSGPICNACGYRSHQNAL